MTISIIIPTLNEEKNLRELLPLLKENGGNDLKEIIVSDARSDDSSLLVTKAHGAIYLLSPIRGRASQMNFGASRASGEVLYFVHADSRPPTSYTSDILEAVRTGSPMGCYRFKFDSKKIILKINSFFTRFDKLICRGGDQTFFIRKEIFNKLNGYDENYRIMEEFDFLNRARKKYPFKIIPKNVIVSARKYNHNSYLKVNIANLMIYLMFWLGCSQKKMIQTYYRILRQDSYKFET